MTRTRKAALASLILLPVLAGGFALQARSTRGRAQLLDQVLALLRTTLAQNQSLIEARVRERPAEWFWVHKRWANAVYDGTE